MIMRMSSDEEMGLEMGMDSDSDRDSDSDTMDDRDDRDGGDSDSVIMGYGDGDGDGYGGLGVETEKEEKEEKLEEKEADTPDPGRGRRRRRRNRNGNGSGSRSGNDSPRKRQKQHPQQQQEQDQDHPATPTPTPSAEEAAIAMEMELVISHPSPPPLPPLSWTNYLRLHCPLRLTYAHQVRSIIFAPPNPVLFHPPPSSSSTSTSTSTPRIPTMRHRALAETAQAKWLHGEDISWWLRGTIAALASPRVSGLHNEAMAMEQLMVLTNITVGQRGAGGAIPAWSGSGARGGAWFMVSELPPRPAVLLGAVAGFVTRGGKMVLATAWIESHWILLLLVLRPGEAGAGTGTVECISLDTLPDAHSGTPRARGAQCLAQLRAELSPGVLGGWHWGAPRALDVRAQASCWECGYSVCARADIMMRAWVAAGARGGEGGRGVGGLMGGCVRAAEGGGKWFDEKEGGEEGDWWAPAWGTREEVSLFVGEVLARDRNV